MMVIPSAARRSRFEETMTPRRKLSEARRTQILEAAVAVIGARGLCDTRIADIAERAGTSSALVLYYFASKDRLLAEALAYSEERFYAETAEQLSHIETAKDQLVRLIELSCSSGKATGENWLDEWVLWLDMWARAPRDPEVARDREALERRWRETIAAIVRDGQTRGEFAAVDAYDFAIRLGALIDGLAIMVVLGDADVSAALMRDMCLRMAGGELGFAPPRPTRRKRAPSASKGRKVGTSRVKAAGGASR
jgi:AcrR family transcriptional regulator